ncbi:MAG: NAD(+) synthase [Spirochaetes bacterium]|nr:NAD(+) synthase [Spirochaetota bacterium]
MSNWTGYENFGFFKVAVASPRVMPADPAANVSFLLDAMKEAEKQGARLLVLPELCITGYTCGDLFHQQVLLEAAESGIRSILAQTADFSLITILGAPVPVGNRLYNAGIVIQEGKILGIVPKQFLPNYKEFYEERWFSSGVGTEGMSVWYAGSQVPFGRDLLFRSEEDPRFTFGLEICEDLWSVSPPSAELAREGALILCNLSASNEVIGKNLYRRDLVRMQSARCVAAYLYAGSGVLESTTDLVFGGSTFIAENGVILAEGKRFSRELELVVMEVDLDRLLAERRMLTPFMDRESPSKTFPYRIVPVLAGRKGSARRMGQIPFLRWIDPHPFVPSNPAERDERCEEIFSIQIAGLAKRMEHTRSGTAIVGISGGLDSTLALLVTVRTFDLLKIPRKRILAVTMPGFGTTDHTYQNALQLMSSLGVDIREIDIKDACLKHFEDIGHDPNEHDTTYENVQARERTQILMDLANKHKGLVVGTGDLSELALGWCTYNGDHMSMYGVNSGVPKTLVRYLVQWIADHAIEGSTREVLHRILATPITPELLPPDPKGRIQQKTEDIIGPYELHDFYLYHFLRYGAPPDKILFLAGVAFQDRYDENTLRKWLKVFLRRFFSQQYKRSCVPDGPKVGSINLSPRGDWRMPSDASVEAWLARGLLE